MAYIICEVCGNEISVSQEEHSALCPACGAKNRVPASITRTERDYHIAARLRVSGDYGRAIECYQKIYDMDPDELEACWGIILCKYGVSYTGQGEDRKLQCSRINESAVTADIYYKTLMNYADSKQRSYFEQEAVKIQEAQKQLRQFALRESNYDVYLSYKELEMGEGDLTDAEEIKQLVSFLEKQGLRVFYDRKKTAREHPGEEKMYMLAAQYTAKVMLVYGSRKSFFSHGPVQEEWSSYLMLMREGNTKRRLFVLCKDSVMYNLPKALLDQPKISIDRLDFYDQVKKEIFTDRSFADKAGARTSDKVENFYTRAQIFLEDEEYDEADRYFERIINESPQDSRAYWGRLLCECKCRNGEQLKNSGILVDEMPAYRSAVRYALPEDRDYYEEIGNEIRRAYEARKTQEQNQKLKEQSQKNRKELDKEKERINLQLRDRETKRKKAAARRQMLGFAMVAVIAAAAAAGVWYYTTGRYNSQIKEARALLEEGRYEEAERAFSDLILADKAEESDLDEVYYEWGKSCIQENNINSGVSYLMSSNGYEDANDILDDLLVQADALSESGNTLEALDYYDALSSYDPGAKSKVADILQLYRDWLTVHGPYAVIKNAAGTAMIYGYGPENADVSGWNDLAGVYAAENCIFGWTSAGTVYATGTWTTESFADWTDVVQVIGNDTNVFALTSQGSVLVKGTLDGSLVSGFTGVKRLYMGQDGRIAVLFLDNTLICYDESLNNVLANYYDAADASFTGNVLVVMHNTGVMEQSGDGSVRLVDRDAYILYPGERYYVCLDDSRSACTYLLTANHFETVFNGAPAGCLGAGIGYNADYYDEYIEDYEEAIYYINSEGEVYISYFVHSYNSMGAPIGDSVNEQIATVF